MQDTLLKIKDLSVTYKDSSSHVEAVRHISMDINKVSVWVLSVNPEAEKVHWPLP